MTSYSYLTIRIEAIEDPLERLGFEIGLIAAVYIHNEAAAWLQFLDSLKRATRHIQLVDNATTDDANALVCAVRVCLTKLHFSLWQLNEVALLYPSLHRFDETMVLISDEMGSAERFLDTITASQLQ